MAAKKVSKKTKTLVRTPKLFKYQGKDRTVAEISRMTGIGYSTMYDRLVVAGTDIKAAVTEGDMRSERGRRIKYEGQTYSIQELADHLGLALNSIYGRIARHPNDPKKWTAPAQGRSVATKAKPKAKKEAPKKAAKGTAKKKAPAKKAPAKKAPAKKAPARKGSHAATKPKTKFVAPRKPAAKKPAKKTTRKEPSALAAAAAENPTV